MASISGSVTIAGDPDDWIATAFDADTHAFAGVAAVSAGAYEITGLTAGKAYVVACRPKSGPAWAATRATTLGDYTVPTAPDSTPYVYQATSSSGGDPYFSSNTLLLHMDGANGSTTFTDVTGKTVTPVAGAQISTSQSKFGGASGYFNGTNAYLSIAHNAAFNFGTGDFTIEFWLYTPIAWTSQPASSSIIGKKANDASNGWVIYRDGGQPSKLNGRLAAGNNFFTASSPTQNTWEHWALVRHGTAITWYKNGVTDATGTSSANLSDASAPLLLGLGSTWPNSYLNAYLDDVRITTGLARYTEDFTPPSQAFADAALTGSAEPTWPTTPGNTVEDGDVTWTNMGQFVQPLMQGPLIAA